MLGFLGLKIGLSDQKSGKEYLRSELKAGNRFEEGQFSEERAGMIECTGEIGIFRKTANLGVNLAANLIGLGQRLDFGHCCRG